MDDVTGVELKPGEKIQVLKDGDGNGGWSN